MLRAVCRDFQAREEVPDNQRCHLCTTAQPDGPRWPWWRSVLFRLLWASLWLALIISGARNAHRNFRSSGTDGSTCIGVRRRRSWLNLIGRACRLQVRFAACRLRFVQRRVTRVTLSALGRQNKRKWQKCTAFVQRLDCSDLRQKHRACCLSGSTAVTDTPLSLFVNASKSIVRKPARLSDTRLLQGMSPSGEETQMKRVSMRRLASRILPWQWK